MGPLAQFIIALTNLVRSGAIRKIPQAIKFAEQQFGKVTPLLKKQIEKVFESAKKPVVGKPGKKEGAVIPMVKEVAKKDEGIASLEDAPTIEGQMEKIEGASKRIDELMKERDAMYKPKPDPKESQLMNKLEKKIEEMRLSDDDPMGDLEQILNPKRPGGSLDQVTGITRGLARKILDRKGIEIGKNDPIDVFTDTFGEAITDVKNLAEEMVEADKIGRNLKSPDELLEIEGLFDIEIPKNPQRGLTDEEMLQLDKQVKEEKNLEQLEGLGALKLAERFRLKKKYPGIDDELLTNIIEDTDPQHKAEVLAQLDEAFEMMSQGKGPDEIIDIFESLKNTRKDNATGGRVRAASGGLADILKV